MNPYERWDDWEWEKAAQSIGHDYKYDGRYDQNGIPRDKYYINKPSRDFLESITGSQKRVVLSALLFLTVIFSSRGEDLFSQSVYAVYRNGMDSGNFYAAMNSMAKEAIGIQQSEGLAVSAGIQELFYPPVAGIVKVGYRGSGINGELSRGIEIESALGKEVLCPGEGVVLEVSESESLGRVIRVNFGDGWEGILGNLGGVSVKRGDPVSMGLKLGTVGVSSSRQKPWLYFELIKDGKVVNPLNYLIQSK